MAMSFKTQLDESAVRSIPVVGNMKEPVMVCNRAGLDDPSKVRTKNRNELKGFYLCSKCKLQGYTSTKCPN